MDQLSFGGGGGGVLVEKLLDVALVGFGVLGGQDRGLGGETVAQGVAGGTLFAGFGAGAGGVERVGSVGGGAVFLRRAVDRRICGLASVRRDPLLVVLVEFGLLFPFCAPRLRE